MKQTRVSIAIVTYKNDDQLRACLQSLFRLRREGIDLEILIVDNANLESTRKLTEKFAQFVSRDASMEVRYCLTEENHLGKARALAINEARHRWVAFIDSDCEASEDWLRALIETRKRHKSDLVAAIGGPNVPPRERNSFYAAQDVMHSTFLGNLNSTQSRRLQDEQAVYHLPSCNVLYNKALVLKVGNFSDQFPRVGEDLDLSHRLGANGFKLIYSPQAVVYHSSQTTMKGWVKKIFGYGFIQWFIIRKHPKSLEWRLLLPPFFLLFWIILLGAAFVAPKISLVFGFSYFLFLFALSLYLCLIRNCLPLSFRIFILFIATHFSYAIGESIGIVASYFFLPKKEGRPV